jgi:methyl-accepting chemotaxis protein
MRHEHEGTESMSAKINTEAAHTLEKSGANLQWVLRTAEDAINALVGSFQGLAGDADTILKQAAAIVVCVENESVSAVLPIVHDLGIVARQFVDDRLQAISGILETVSAEMELLHKLSLVMDGQGGMAFRIRMLNVHTKIEVAHLGSVGADFEYLARELANFSKSLAQNTKELTSHTGDRRAATEKTKFMLSSELPRLRDELTRVGINISDDLAVLDPGLAKLSRIPAQFKQSTEDIARQIAGVVVAVQGHDITRQQIEHVQEAVEAISATMLAERNSTAEIDPEIARAYAGLTIQTFQLKAIKGTIAGWTSQIKTCMDTIFGVSVSELVGIGPLVLEQEHLVSSQLAHIDLLEQECQAYGERIRSTLEGISNLSQLVAEHLQKAESARSHLRLLTFNSVIEAARLGTKADTICVIADGIAEVSTEWAKITEQSENVLQEILTLTKRVNEVMTTFSQASGEKFKESQARTKSGLDTLREAAAFAIAQGRKIVIVTETMQIKSGEIGKSSDLLNTCFARIDEVLADIESAKRQLESYYPDVKRKFNAAEVERQFSAAYTTQTERDVMSAAIYGTEFSAPQQCSIGNSVELF